MKPLVWLPELASFIDSPEIFSACPESAYRIDPSKVFPLAFSVSTRAPGPLMSSA
jgi:hypothetical protein